MGKCELFEMELPQDALSPGEKVLVHAPDGLKILYECIGSELQRLGVDAYYSSAPGYGACDLPFEEAQALGASKILHLGHGKYPYEGFRLLGANVVYVPVYYKAQLPTDLLEKLVNILQESNAKTVTVSSTLVETKIREVVAIKLAERGFKVVKISEPVLGCLYSPVTIHDWEADAHVLVAGGYFHALGLGLSSKRKVFLLDPYRLNVENISPFSERTLKKRLYKVLDAKNRNCRRIGLVIGSRPGQYRPGLIRLLENEAVKENLVVIKISSTYLDKDRLIAIDNALNLDAYVVTSCPRLPIDDLEDFYKPVLTPGEFMMLLGNNVDRYIYPW